MLDEGTRILRSYLEHRMQKARSPERKVRAWVAGILEQALNEHGMDWSDELERFVKPDERA